MKYFTTLFLFLVVTGCSSTTVSSQGDKHMIQCLNEENRCHEKARNVCDDGYLVTNRTRPVRMGEDTQYTLNIKCRQPTMY